MIGKKLLACFVTAAFGISIAGIISVSAVTTERNTGYTIEDIRNLQDFLLVRETPDLRDKDYDLNDDGRWNVFDLCLMKREYVKTLQSEEDISSPNTEDLTYEYAIEELYANRDGNQIYGAVYIPQNAGAQMPAVIFSHGFGGNYQVGTQYAEALAEKGYVVYCFDFCGGSPGSRSDGSTLEMSIFTEQTDLEAVITMLQGLDYVDSNNLFLMGTSQGGAVSAITAAAHKEEIQGAILLYPAFCLVDQTKERFDSIEDIPDTYFLMWMTVGRAYAENLLDYDIYDAISSYEKDVLILHGDADSIVSLSYSEKALEVYSSARLEVFPGAGHGFHGQDTQQAIGLMLEYLGSHRNQ